MKNILASLVILIVAGTACTTKKDDTAHDHSSHPPAAAVDTVKKSLPKEEHAMVGKAHITIKYTAPLVKGRTIWGGLVAYDQVWVSGAHRATSFEINRDFKAGGQTIPAGKYALFTIPAKDNWIFIINKNWDQHLADDYNPKDDVARVTLAPVSEQTHQERLLYKVEKTDESHAAIALTWEKLRIVLPIEIL